METFLALIKIINPIEWLKECYKMPKFVKLAAIFICFLLLFLPDTIRGISTKLMIKFSLVFTPIMLICFLGELGQEMYLEKQKKKYEREAKQKQLETEEKNRIEQVKKEQQEKLEKEQEAQKIINDYFKSFDLCDDEEKDIFTEFFLAQKTSIYAGSSKIATAQTINSKDINIFGTNSFAGKITITPSVLKLINMYFDKDKERFFNTINALQEPELRLIEKFYKENDNQLILNKKQIKIAYNLRDVFNENNFKEIYVNDDCIKISELYSHYLCEYFGER